MIGLHIDRNEHARYRSRPEGWSSFSEFARWRPDRREIDQACTDRRPRVSGRSGPRPSQWVAGSPVAIHLHMATTFGWRTTATLLHPMSSPHRLVAARGRARRRESTGLTGPTLIHRPLWSGLTHGIVIANWHDDSSGQRGCGFAIRTLSADRTLVRDDTSPHGARTLIRNDGDTGPRHRRSAQVRGRECHQRACRA